MPAADPNPHFTAARRGSGNDGFPDRTVEYVDSSGRVPRGAADIDNANLLKTLLLTRLVLSFGGSVELDGFQTPEAVSTLMSYELKVSGAGDGRFLLEAVPKTPSVCTCGHELDQHAVDGRGVTPDPYCETDDCTCDMFTPA